MWESTRKHPENEREFERFLEGYDRVIVEFYPDWCRPCERTDPVIDSVGEPREMPVLKIRVERNPAIAAKFDVEAVPTIATFEDGEPIARQVGRQGGTEPPRLIGPIG